MSGEFEIKVFEKLDNIDKKIDKVNKKVNKVDEKVNKLDKKIDEVEKRTNKRMDDMNETLVLLEYKMTTEFPALYEIYSLNYEIQKKNEKRLKSVEKATSKNSIQIEHLYDTVRNHENQLKKLTS